MAGYASQLIRLRRCCIGPFKQGAYGTALLDAKFTHNLRFDGKGFPQSPLKQFYDDQNLAKGFPQASFRIETERQTKLTLSGLPMYDFIAGWLAAFCIGKDSVSGMDPYTHLFTQDLSTSLSPVTSVYIEDTADLKYKFPDMAIESLKFTGGAIGPVLCDVSLIGSGRETDGALASVPALATPTFMLNNDADILLGAPGAAASIKSRVRGWTITIGTPQEDVRHPGSGIYAGFTRRGDLSLGITLDIAAKDSDDIRTLLINDTEQELQINIASDAASTLKFKFPHLKFKGQGAEDGQFVKWALTADNGDIFNNGTDEPLQLTVINHVATYLTT